MCLGLLGLPGVISEGWDGRESFSSVLSRDGKKLFSQRASREQAICLRANLTKGNVYN